MQDFFTDFFGAGKINTNAERLAGGGGDASPGLSRLASGLKSGSSEVLHTVIIVAIFVSIIMLMVAFIMYFVSTRGPTRDQSKQRIMRTLISIALISLTASLVTAIFFGIFGSSQIASPTPGGGVELDSSGRPVNLDVPGNPGS